MAHLALAAMEHACKANARYAQGLTSYNAPGALAESLITYVLNTSYTSNTLT